MSKSLAVPFKITLRFRDTCLHVQQAACTLERRLDSLLRPLGLTHGPFLLLMVLNRLDPPGLGVVASLSAMDRATLTAVLTPPKWRGLVLVTPDPTEHRSRHLPLTPAGLTLLAAAIPVWEQARTAIQA